MKHIFILTVFFMSISIYSQEEYLKVSLEDIKTSTTPIENVHLVKNYQNELLSVFVEEAKVTYGFLYNKNLVQVGELTSKGLKRKYKEIIGQATKGNNTRLIQKNNKGTKFASIFYDFETKQTEELEYDLDMSDEKFVQSYSKDASCYVFTIVKNENTLKKYEFTIDGEVKIEEISLTKKMEENKFNATKLYDLFTVSSGLIDYIELAKLDNRLPNTLEISSNESKMFSHNNGFYWTLDKNDQFTLLLDFQLPNLHPEIKVILKPKPDGNYRVSNSYLLDDVIAQIVSNSQKMQLIFKNLSTQEVLKEYIITKDDEVSFRNSAILQEGSTYSFGSTRKLEKTSKFLRKISSYRNGVSLFKDMQGYQATIGGIRKPSSGGGGFGAFGALPFGAIGTIGALSMSFNPASFAYGSYGSVGSTRVESLFYENFEHREGNIPKNIFDRIDILSGKWTKNADNVYVIDDFVLFGNYQTSIMTFNLFKFENY